MSWKDDEIERLQVNAAHWKERHDTVLQKHIECCGAPAQGASIVPEAKFLLDRLQEFDPGDFDAERDFHGHVAPAIARLRNALYALPSTDRGRK